MKDKLYIIGNGFDLHFGLPTRPSDFERIVKTKHSYDGFNAADVLCGYGVEWGIFEASLASFDVDLLIEEHLICPDYLSDYERDRVCGITNMECYLGALNDTIRKSIKEMVLKANELAKTIKPKVQNTNLIEPNSPVITFNYTSTVELLFGIKCFHIHGCFEDGDELVFGYKEEFETRTGRELTSDFEEDHDYYLDTQKKMALEFYRSLKKKLRIEELENYLSSIAGVDEIVVIGHSMSDVDAQYFEILEQRLKPTKWVVYYHNELPITEPYSFDDKIELIKW